VLEGNAVGRFTQIECSKGTVKATFTGELLVRRLLSESDHCSEASICLEVAHQRSHQALLDVLHSSWLESDNSGSFLRLDDGNNPAGSFLVGQSVKNIIEAVVIPPGWEHIFPIREYRFEPMGPLNLIVLTVSGESISGVPWPMFGQDVVVVDIFVEFRQDISEQHETETSEFLL
jgi:hypothetical protein